VISTDVIVNVVFQVITRMKKKAISLLSPPQKKKKEKQTENKQREENEKQYIKQINVTNILTGWVIRIP